MKFQARFYNFFEKEFFWAKKHITNIDSFVEKYLGRKEVKDKKDGPRTLNLFILFLKEIMKESRFICHYSINIKF